MTLVRALLVCALVAMTACKSADKAPAPAARAIDPAHLTTDDVNTTYHAIFQGPGSENVPLAKKVADFEAKIGSPKEHTADTRVWFARKGTDCVRVEVGPDGTMSIQEKPAAPPSNCGL